MKMVKFTTNVRQCALNTTASLLLLASMLFSCSPSLERPEEVPNVISQDSMVMILTDVLLIEGAKVGNNMMGDTLEPPHYYRHVYDKFGVSRQSFETSFQYYSERPGQMNAIYEKAIENLSKLEKSPPRERLIEEDE